MDNKKPHASGAGLSVDNLAAVTGAHSIAKLCRKLGIAETTFGRDAINDPRLIGDLRAGRQLRPSTAARVAAHCARIGGGHG